MNLRPVLAREMRSQARSRANFGLRVTGAAGLIFVSLIFALISGLNPQGGAALFGWLNFFLFCFIWLMTPLSVADAISEERREGTIGLLFLTPLKSGEIVIAKILAHAVRTLSLWLAAIPVLTIPFLLGGIGKQEVLMSILNNFTSICLALGAGIIASARTKHRLRAQAFALLAAASFGAVYLFCGGQILTSIIIHGKLALSGGVTATTWPAYGSGPNVFAPTIPYGPQAYQYMTLSQEMTPVVGFFQATDFRGCWSYMLPSLSVATRHQWLVFSFSLAVCAILTLCACFLIAALTLRRVWREEPPSARRQWIEQKLVTPIFGIGLLRAWSRRTLARNPIGWLEQRSWSGRLVMWSWMGVVISIYGFALSGTYSAWVIYRIQDAMAWLLLLGVAASAANSFRRERETGVMELLLVSPLSEWQVIGGRIRGLYAQFLPALLLLGASTYYFRRGLTPGSETDSSWLYCYLPMFLSIPVVGLYFSLKLKSFPAAFLGTMSACILPAAIIRLYFISRRGLFYFQDGRVPAAGIALTDLFLAGLTLALLTALHRTLNYRTFAFQRTMS